MFPITGSNDTAGQEQEVHGLLLLQAQGAGPTANILVNLQYRQTQDLININCLPSSMKVLSKKGEIDAHCTCI